MFLSLKAMSVFLKGLRLAGTRRWNPLFAHWMCAACLRQLWLAHAWAVKVPHSCPGRPVIHDKTQILFHIVAGESADKYLLSCSCSVSELSPNMLFNSIYYYSTFPKLISGLTHTHFINVKVVWINIGGYHHSTFWRRLTTVLQLFCITWQIQR